MNRCLALLPALLVASVALAAPGLTPGSISEFNVELPAELRQMAGRGRLSPVTHALVSIAAPAKIDMAHDWPVLLISATSDPQHHSSRRLLRAYVETALAAGWIVVAADPVEDVTVEQDDVPLRLALTKAAFAALELQWPGAGTAPLAFGGFSGGAKYSSWLAAAYASEGHTVIGIYMAGINRDTLVSAAEHFNVLNAAFKSIPVFLQSGETDEVSTPADHRAIHADLKRAGFRRVRIEYFQGSHDVDPAPLRMALEWFHALFAYPAAQPAVAP
jgi:predicted esterase